MHAAAASFATIDRVIRLVKTGPAVNTSDQAAIGATVGRPASAPKSLREDFIVLEGTLKNCGGSCSPANLGVNGGGFGRVFVSANGSGNGLKAAAGILKIGFIGLFGNDGIAGNADDPVVSASAPPGWPAGDGPTYSLAGFTRAPLVQCSTSIKATYVDPLPGTGLSGEIQPVWNVTAATELCIVDLDANNNGNIDGRDLGSSTTPAVSGLETSNSNQTTNLGFGDLPPGDFSDPSIASLNISPLITTGAQIFKIVANRNVRAKADSTKKISLEDPQIEALFGGTDLGVDACKWQDVGGQVVGDAAGKITVCFREPGSGTREAFRNTFMLDAKGQHGMGTTNGDVGCDSFIEADAGGNTVTTTKKFRVADTSANMVNCLGGVSGFPGISGQVGYVNASRTSTNYYAVPVFGVDPDTQPAGALRDMVKCGRYPYWGPLSGGRGLAPDNALAQAQINAMSSLNVFDNTVIPDYLPVADFNTGVAFNKDFVAGQYSMKYGVTSDCTGLPAVAPGAP
jgi:hypothetical protein